MLRHEVLLRFARPILLVVAISWGAPSQGIREVFAAPKESDEETASQLVTEALHRQLYGMQSDRERLLAEAARKFPHYAPAHWHRGYIRGDATWKPVDAVIREVEPTPLEKSYELRRTESPDTIAGHLALANWSRDNQLELQERAHLSRIVELDSEHEVARGRLGFVLNQNGEWITREELRQSNERLAKEREVGERWQPLLGDVRRGLLHEQPKRRQIARARLDEIQDPHVIPALEATLSTISEEAALAVVDVLSRIQDQEGVNGLVRHAVFSQWPLVREAAADRLRERPQESFVPAMIGQMFTTTSTEYQVAILPDGRLGYRHVLQREGFEDRQVMVLDTAYARVRRMQGDGRETLGRAFLDSLAGVAQREVAVVRQNLLQVTLNERLTDALNIATRSQLPADPRRWWQWWDEENDVVRAGGKQIRQRQAFQLVAVRDRRPPQAEGGTQLGTQVSTPRQRSECFAAGTPVLTRRGPVSIEKILVGDLVLAQNVDTGELAFKPVLSTTIRPAETLVKLTIGRDTLQSSQGHLFWVAGVGWRQSKQLQSSAELHSLSGSQPILNVEPGESAVTYNLIVADFHTYFVGQERILSHDVTSRRPTASILPGLKVTD